MKVLRYVSLAAFAVFFATACQSYSTVHTATPVEEGTAEIKAAAGGYGASVSTGGESANAVIPNFEFHGRYGLGNNMDFGGKIFPIGAGFDFNYAVVNESSFAFSINPAISGLTAGGGGSSGFVGFGLLNLLADVVKTESFVLTVGAKPGGQLAAGGGASQFTPMVGGTLGATVNLGDTFALQPWFDALYNVDGGGLLYTGLLGFSFSL